MDNLPTKETCAAAQKKRPASLSELLDLLGADIQSQAFADIYLINLLDANGTSLVCRSIHFSPEFKNLEQTFLGKKTPLDERQLATNAFARRETMRITPAIANDAEAHILNYWKAAEIIAIPLGDPAQPEAKSIGVLVLVRQKDQISDEALQQLQCLLNSYYPDIAHWLRFSHLEELHNEAMAAIDENKRLLKFLDELNSLTSVDKIYELFASQLFRQMSFDVAAFSLVDNDQLVCKKIVTADPKFDSHILKWQEFLSENPCPLDPKYSGSVFVLFRNEPLLFPDMQAVKHLPMSEYDAKSMSYIDAGRTVFVSPIRYQKKPIGVFSLYSMTDTITVSEADQHLLGHLASFLGTALTNSMIYATSQKQNLEIGHLNKLLQEKVEELAQQASTDQLTGLFNFRTFKQELDKRLNETQRASADSGLALVMIDNDHFKNFNDTNGHAAGNDILAGLANELGKHIRQSDLACRYGGEEFVVILPKCDLAGARQLAERIRGGIEKRIFETGVGKRSITVSIGCTVHVPADTQESLFARADAALYEAKHNGRNQVCTG
jgi:diguanylate cyclase (GGDEF)-like protein